MQKKEKEKKIEMREAASIMGRKGGTIGGKSKSVNKQKASRENGKKSIQPHLEKVKFFESIFPFDLINNEFKDKFKMIINKKETTYNPDYYCPALKSYIEVTTSKPNISEQGPKWREAIKLGHSLKIYWWEGEEITNRFL